MVPLRSPTNHVPCALQTPGAGVQGEAESPAVRGGGGARAVLGAGPAAEGCAGGGPAAPSGRGGQPPPEAEPDPEGRGVRGVEGCLPPGKTEARLPKGPSSTPTPPWSRIKPSPWCWGFHTKEHFLQPWKEPISQPKQKGSWLFWETHGPSCPAVWAAAWGTRGPLGQRLQPPLLHPWDQSTSGVSERQKHQPAPPGLEQTQSSGLWRAPHDRRPPCICFQ